MVACVRKDIENIRMWFKCQPSAINNDEINYINHTKDLMNVIRKLKTPLRRCLELSTKFCFSKSFRREAEDPGAMHCDPQLMCYQNCQLIKQFVTIVISFVCLLMLVVPF